jgi:hypothetical protein
MEKIMKMALLLLLAVATLYSQDIVPSGGRDGNLWYVGSTQFISWPVAFMDTTKTVDIYLWNADSATYSTIAENIPVSDEYYLWTIPVAHPIGEKFKAKVVYHDGYRPDFKLFSKDFFPIEVATSIGANGNSSSRPIYVVNKNSNFDIFPNPSSEFITIDSKSKFFSVEIFDTHGELVFHNKFEYRNTYSIDIKRMNLASSTYSVRVKFLGSEALGKFVITK